MPIEQAQTINVTCDNPNCPGHSDLAADDLTGWLVISSEVYGQPTHDQVVVGNADCLAGFSNALAADELSWPQSAQAIPPPPPLDDASSSAE